MATKTIAAKTAKNVNNTKNGKNITLNKQEVNELEHIKPFCEKSQKAAEAKKQADEVRPLAADELRAKLDSSPETKDFTGTVVYICEGEMYKIRVQRPASCNWREKRLSDHLHKEYLALMKEKDALDEKVKEKEDKLAKAHPKCITKGFTIAYLSK